VVVVYLEKDKFSLLKMFLLAGRVIRFDCIALFVLKIGERQKIQVGVFLFYFIHFTKWSSISALNNGFDLSVPISVLPHQTHFFLFYDIYFHSALVAKNSLFYTGICIVPF